jgi:hypothetical protein
MQVGGRQIAAAAGGQRDEGERAAHEHSLFLRVGRGER